MLLTRDTQDDVFESIKIMWHMPNGHKDHE